MTETDPDPLALVALNAGFFEPLLQSHFFLQGGGRSEGCDLTLVEVNLLGHRRPEASREPFSLIFQGPPRHRLPQGIHRLQHPKAGSMDVFVTQVGDSPAGSLFEVIFT